MVEWTGWKIIGIRFPKFDLGRETTVRHGEQKYLVYATVDRGRIQRARAIQFRNPENRAIITR